eukprot:Lithocolla_globosa_v1_NODE_2615_length_1933_cov_6.440895.p1 type:complete len:322 gc:universal NODE_2615_length_1933_cov_6.440895:1074-109(-)
MPARASSDVRWLVIKKWQKGKTTRQIMSDLDKGRTFVQKIKRIYRRYADVVDPFKEKGGRRRILSRATMDFLRDLLADHPTLYLDQIQSEVEAFAEIKVSRSTIWRSLKSLGFTWKKLTKIALQQNKLLVAHFMSRISRYDAKHIAFFDETYKDNRTLLREYGWAVTGKRVRVHRLKLRGIRYTLAAAVTINGPLTFPKICIGGLKGPELISYTRDILIPAMHSLQLYVLVLDNCSTHRNPEFLTLLSENEIIVEFLPPYTPTLNPIEPVFNQVKQFLRSHSEWALQQTDPAYPLVVALESVSGENMRNYMRSAGYYIMEE